LNQALCGRGPIQLQLTGEGFSAANPPIAKSEHHAAATQTPAASLPKIQAFI